MVPHNYDKFDFQKRAEHVIHSAKHWRSLQKKAEADFKKEAKLDKKTPDYSTPNNIVSDFENKVSEWEKAANTLTDLTEEKLQISIKSRECKAPEGRLQSFV